MTIQNRIYMQNLLNSIKEEQEALLKENIAGMPPAGGSPLGSMPPGGMRRMPTMGGNQPFAAKSAGGQDTSQVQGDPFNDKMDVIGQDGQMGFPPSWWTEQNGPFVSQTDMLFAWFQWMGDGGFQGNYGDFINAFGDNMTPAMEQFWSEYYYNFLYPLQNFPDVSEWNSTHYDIFNRWMEILANYNSHMAAGYINNPTDAGGGLTGGLGSPFGG